MSVLEPGAAESFIFRTWKHHNGNPAVKWANTYEARFTELGTSDDLDSLLVGLVQFEAELLFNTATVEYGTISTWSEDSHPYDPAAFRTTPFNEVGHKSPSTAQVADLRVCLYLKRDVDSGRIGKIFLRNSVLFADLVTPAGVMALEAPETYAGDVAEAIISGGLGANFDGGASQPTLALIGSSQVTRFLSGFSLGGVAVVKLNHKYFDRP